MLMGLRKNIVYGACWLLGGHRHRPLAWEHDGHFWVRRVACSVCGAPASWFYESSSKDKPLDV